MCHEGEEKIHRREGGLGWTKEKRAEDYMQEKRRAAAEAPPIIPLHFR